MQEQGILLHSLYAITQDGLKLAEMGFDQANITVPGEAPSPGYPQKIPG
jgi:hypothetical protein